MDNVFSSLSHISSTVCEVNNILTKQAKEKLSLSQSVQLGGLTNGGLVLTLHNKEQRPTVYTVEIKTDKLGGPSSLVLDTIYVGNKSNGKQHKAIKEVQPLKYGNVIINTLKELSEQFADGEQDNTLSNFKRLGLFYIPKAN
jgi:hypothetical protein